MTTKPPKGHYQNIPDLPRPPAGIADPLVRRYLEDLHRTLVQELERRQSKGTPANPLLLSPNGELYQISISNTGVIQTDLIYSPT